MVWSGEETVTGIRINISKEVNRKPRVNPKYKLYLKCDENQINEGKHLICSARITVYSFEKFQAEPLANIVHLNTFQMD